MTARRRSGAIGAALAIACVVTAVPALAGGGATSEAQNHRAAVRDAKMLLSRFQLPSGTTASSTEPAGDHRRLRQPFGRPAITELVDRVAWWTTSGSPGAVIRYLKAHPPEHGFLEETGHSGQCKPHTFPPQDCHTTALYLGFDFPAVDPRLGFRALTVTATRLSDGSTGLRADALVQWIVPRAASEVVPDGVQVVDVTKGEPGQPPSVSQAVTNRTQVHKIVKLIDSLPVLQPGYINCPGNTGTGPVDTFTFRDQAGGPAVSKASVYANVGDTDTACDAMDFWIGSREQTPLVRAQHFLKQVGRLIGAKLTAPSGY